jgi:hypothetical protein
MSKEIIKPKYKILILLERYENKLYCLMSSVYIPPLIKSHQENTAVKSYKKNPWKNLKEHIFLL